MKYVIKPVTFIDDKVTKDENLNELFITPYKFKTMTDLNKSKIIDSLKENMNKKEYNFWAKNYSKESSKDRDHIIFDYIKMNISDLYTSSIIRIKESVFDGYSLPVLENYEIIRALPEFRFDEDILFGSYEVPWQYVYDSGKLYIIQYMDCIFSNITKLYNDWITNIIILFEQDKYLDDLYKDIYLLVYNGETTKEVSKEMQYTFLSSTIREIINDELQRIRLGLASISETVLAMIMNHYEFQSHIYDQSYRTSNINEFKEFRLSVEEDKNE